MRERARRERGPAHLVRVARALGIAGSWGAGDMEGAASAADFGRAKAAAGAEAHASRRRCSDAVGDAGGGEEAAHPAGLGDTGFVEACMHATTV